MKKRRKRQEKPAEEEILETSLAPRQSKLPTYERQ
jgi:hypothetical protein